MVEKDIYIEAEKAKIIINNEIYGVGNLIGYRLTFGVGELNENGLFPIFLGFEFLGCFLNGNFKQLAYKSFDSLEIEANGKKYPFSAIKFGFVEDDGNFTFESKKNTK